MLTQSYRELLNLSSYNWQQDHNIVEMMDQSHGGEMQLRICALLLHYQIYPSWPWRILLHLEQGPRQIFHPNFPLALAMSYQAIPLILRDSTVPSRPAKVSFPNQRQVSPPPPQSHLHELESRSSGDLRSVRKFILKGVPSFPPLTPCIDSRGSKDENDSNFEENNSSI